MGIDHSLLGRESLLTKLSETRIQILEMVDFKKLLGTKSSAIEQDVNEQYFLISEGRKKGYFFPKCRQKSLDLDKKSETSHPCIMKIFSARLFLTSEVKCWHYCGVC